MKKLFKILFLTIIVGGGATAGWLYYTGYFNTEAEIADANNDEGEEVVEELAQIYLPLDPPFVVNFTHRGTLRYLQLSLELMYTDQEIIDEITRKMPAIRNSLIILFSNQDYESISTQLGKETLRQNILHAVNDVIGLKEVSDGKQQGEAYFTNFVMQ